MYAVTGGACIRIRIAHLYSNGNERVRRHGAKIGHHRCEAINWMAYIIRVEAATSRQDGLCNNCAEDLMWNGVGMGMGRFDGIEHIHINTYYIVHTQNDDDELW